MWDLSSLTRNRIPTLYIGSSVFFIYLFIWLHRVFVALCGLSLVVISVGYSLLPCTGFSLCWLFLWSTGSRAYGLQWLWRRDLVGPQRVGSSQTRDGTHVTCIGRSILIFSATREVLFYFLTPPFLCYFTCVKYYIL